MIYKFLTISSAPYNCFHVDEKYWKQSDLLSDHKIYLSTIQSDNPYLGRSFKENWKTLKIELRSTSKSRKIPDITDLYEARCPVFSEKAMDVLGDLLNDNGEFLELKCIDDKKTYYAYNVLTYIDIIDKNENGKDIWNFKKDPNFDKRSIFKIISHEAYSHYCMAIFLDQKFIDRVEKYKLKGLSIFPKEKP